MKLTMSANPTAPAEYENRLLVSDLFHQLSQPLTTLCCSLELALLQSPTAKEYGQIVGQALHEAEKASALANSIRELLDAVHPGEKAELLDLRRAVGDTIGDLLPVAESAGVKIACLPPSSCPVWFNAHRLRQGLFHLFGSLIGVGGRGSVVTIELEARGPHAQLGLAVSGVADSHGTSQPQPDRELLQRLEMGISRSIFEAAGGSFSVEREARNLMVRVRILRPAR
jgi:signal transduction histidine kinase